LKNNLCNHHPDRDPGWIVEIDVQEREIKWKRFKLGTPLYKELEDKIANVVSNNWMLSHGRPQTCPR